MNVLRALLFPFSILYHAVTAARNQLYDKGLKPSATFDIPVIGVGNLTVGGTGKTPMIEYLVRLLRDRFSVAVVSRGYKRTTSEIIVAGKTDTPGTIGDEPYQVLSKYGHDVRLAVGADRALTISYLLTEHPETEVVLLDDAFQHRRVRPSFQILLSDYHRPFYSDFVLPAGNLRESKTGASRADVVVVTKCPRELDDEQMMVIESRLRGYTSKPIFFAGVRYGGLQPLGGGPTQPFDQAVVVSGIADPTPFLRYVDSNYAVVKHIGFPDHHRYTQDDVRKICKTARKHNAAVITTEKDAVKLSSPELLSAAEGVFFFFLPVEVEFLKNGKDFDEMVYNSIENVIKSQAKQ